MDQTSVLQLLSDYKRTRGPHHGIRSLGIFGSMARDQAAPPATPAVCATFARANYHNRYGTPVPYAQPPCRNDFGCCFGRLRHR